MSGKAAKKATRSDRRCPAPEWQPTQGVAEMAAVMLDAAAASSLTRQGCGSGTGMEERMAQDAFRPS